MSRTSVLGGTLLACVLAQQSSKATEGSLEVGTCLLGPTRGTRRATRRRVVRVGVTSACRILGHAIHRSHLHGTPCHSTER